ncbi:major capsid protein [Vibrio ziniensis]|uniref:Phage coat protein n=1 Tax=Vibrio ziniensis TaxID=2711221 RepID=A0A6G7CI32_9VIBR|nr:major capsid protein [Vibrio ziniensis]QIH41767.1 hypothetical protein G5S32_07090 [Vibrio ziniensis]QIH44217.1 hypothetical protein G5S32_19895 [Vibrio ziniensis]
MKTLNVTSVVSAVSLALVSGAASAAAPDVTGAVASIGEFGVVIGTLGGAYLLLTIAKKAWGKIGG